MWSNYFLATASIASALTGLIFVGLSINIQKIFCISKAHLPGRALGSLSLLTNIMLVSILCLVPAQPNYYLGTEILISGLIIWVMTTRLDLILYRSVELHYKPQYFRNIFYSQLSILPFLTGGLFLICGAADGFYMLIPGIQFSLIKSLVDIWFLIVDIGREG